MKAALPRLKGILLSALIILILASGCTGAVNTAVTQPPADDIPTPTGTPDKASPVPSDTPAPNLVRLVVKAGDGADYTDEISARLRELASQAGYAVEQSESLTESELQNTIAVFWIGDPAELNPLAASAPQIPFVLIGSDKPEPAVNISEIHMSADRVSFIAGLVAILIAPDRRAGGLFSADDPLSPQRMDAFNNGARYFCGRCVPVYAPVVFFPLTSAVSGGQGDEAWKAAFDELNQNRIESLYLPPEAASREMLDYLTGQSVRLVGTASPPEGYASMWAATVTQDPVAALEELWPHLSATGTPGHVINAPIVLRDVNDLLLPPGRQDLVEKIAAELAAGWIEPLSVP